MKMSGGEVREMVSGGDIGILLIVWARLLEGGGMRGGKNWGNEKMMKNDEKMMKK
jgi:hypothetical protein